MLCALLFNIIFGITIVNIMHNMLFVYICILNLFYKRKTYIFVKKSGNEGKIVQSDEKRGTDLQPPC